MSYYLGCGIMLAVCATLFILSKRQKGGVILSVVAYISPLLVSNLIYISSLSILGGEYWDWWYVFVSGWIAFGYLGVLLGAIAWILFKSD